MKKQFTGQTFPLLAFTMLALTMLALTMLTSTRAGAQAGTSFAATYGGTGLQFQYSKDGVIFTGIPGTWGAHPEQSGFQLNNGLLPNTGHGYYQIGFLPGTPAAPAYLTVTDVTSSLYNGGKAVQLKAIGAVYLYDSTMPFTTGTTLNSGAKIFNGSNINVTGTSPWLASALYKDNTYFGYRDTTPGGNGGLFAGTADPLGGAARYGQFDFNNWQASANSHVYIGMDVQVIDRFGVTQTGCVYITDAPEPGPAEVVGVVGLFVAGLLLRARKGRGHPQLPQRRSMSAGAVAVG